MSQLPLSSELSTAVFSDDRRYRYSLFRRWAVGPTMVVVGLNPSAADETSDDPTIRRCIGFAMREKCGALCMLNLFALISTDPRLLKTYPGDRVGPHNDTCIRTLTADVALVVAAWGVHGRIADRDRAVAKMVPNLQCFGRTLDGSPKHPLYLSRSTPLEPWRP